MRNMGSSAVLSLSLSRRWICGIGSIMRSSKRWISSSPAAPWLMLESQCCDWWGGWIYRFHSCGEAKTYGFLINRRGECVRPNMLGGNVVGSSHGWVALHNVDVDVNVVEPFNELFLSDPTTFRAVNLPPVEPTARLRSLILDRRRDGKAFVIVSGAGLALCSPGRSREWTPFSGGAYESLVYSSHHRRLFSLAADLDLDFRVEAWDVESEQPRLDRSIRLEMPELEQRPELARVMYLVDCGKELFVVVRYVDELKTVRNATVGFEVYKIDDRGRGRKMEGSLEGMTMFVGMNHPVAVRDVKGLRRDSIYFAYDKRGCYEKYNGYDVGIFDYQRGIIHPMAINLCHALNKALWFTPAI